MSSEACIRCGGRDGSCDFHSGEAWRAFSTGAFARDPEMAYRDIYVWTCCGKHQPSELVNGAEQPPLRRPGCCHAEGHLFRARVTFVTSIDMSVLFKAAEAMFEQAGIDVDVVPLKQFSPESESGNEAVAICFLLRQDLHEVAMRQTELLRETRPSVPIVIFSDPERVNGWRMQASSSEGMTPEIIRNAVFRAIRWSARPNLSWSPLIFLSYSRVDAAVMRAWAERLDQMQQPCWVDERMLAPGVEWSDEIEAGIRSSENFVMILTKNTPHPTYCWKEVEIARAAGKPIVVVAFDGQRERFLSVEAEMGREWQRFDVYYDEVSGVSRKIPAVVEIIDGTPVAVLLEIDEGARETVFGSNFKELDRMLGAANWVRFWLQNGFGALRLEDRSKG